MKSLSLLLAALSLAPLTAAEATGAAIRTISLGDAVALAAGSAGVEAALEAIAGSEGDRVAARASLLPQIEGGAGVARRSSVIPTGPDSAPLRGSPYNTWDYRLSLGQNILDRAAWLRSDAAKISQRVSVAQHRLALEQTAAQAARAYVALGKARLQLEARQKDLGLAQELMSLAQAQVRAGVAEAINETRAATQVSSARAQVIVAENAIQRTRTDLARAINQAVDADYALTTPLDGNIPAIAVADEVQAVASARRQRPELDIASGEADVARATMQSIKAERLPALKGFADVGRTGPEYDATATNWSAGLQVTVPILDGFAREGRIDSASAGERRARIQARDQGEAVAAEARTARINVASLDEILSVTRERLRLAELELQQARDRFKAGVASNLDVITAQQNLVEAQDDEITNRSESALARIALALAVGQATTIR